MLDVPQDSARADKIISLRRKVGGIVFWSGLDPGSNRYPSWRYAMERMFQVLCQSG